MNSEEMLRQEVTFEGAKEYMIPDKNRDELISIANSKPKIEWYFDFADFEALVVKRIGEEKAKNTLLHHALAGSSQSIEQWLSMDLDTKHHDFENFIRSNISSHKKDTEIKKAA